MNGVYRQICATHLSHKLNRPPAFFLRRLIDEAENAAYENNRSYFECTAFVLLIELEIFTEISFLFWK